MRLLCLFGLHKRVYGEIVDVPSHRATAYEWKCDRCGRSDAEVGFWD
jgi:hypothetical protein